MRVTMHADDVRQLPAYHTETIPPEYLDIMGHMNIQYYMAIFDRAGWNFFSALGMDEAYYRANDAGGFALMQFIRYLAEVHVGETVTVHTRLLGFTAKRIHFMHIMVNDTTHTVAATLEGLGSHADLTVRRTSPYPAHIAQRIQQQLAAHQALGWDAYPCGVIQA